MLRIVHHILVLFVCVRIVSSKTDRSRGLSLLKEEERPRSFNHTYPGCWLGDQFYMVGDRWSPRVEPYGLMVCVKCQCAQVMKRQILQLEGRVLCKNIKTECPPVRCEAPILRPNTCCPVCTPQDMDIEDQYNPLVEVAPSPGTTPAGGDDGSDDFGPAADQTALLVGAFSRRRHPIKTKAVAVLHMTAVQGNNFRYFLRFTRLKSPVLLQFTDPYGVVALARQIPPQQTRAGMVRGVFDDVPASYMEHIRQQRAYVSITTARHKYGELSGRLSTNDIASKVTFEALLSPPEQNGLGALVSLFCDVRSRTASYVIDLGGIKRAKFGSDEFFVTFEKDTEIIYQHLLRLSQSKTQMIGKLRVDTKMAKQMSRGRLHVRVTSRAGQTITGVLKPRLMRQEMITVFSGEEDLEHVAGFLVASLEENGSLRYKLTTDGLMQAKMKEITLQRKLTNRDRWKDLAILTHTFKQIDARNGLAVGHYKKMRVRETVAVLGGKLRVRIHTDNGTTYGDIRRFFTGGLDLFSAARERITSSRCDVNAYLWFQINRNCSFSYHVQHSDTSLFPESMTFIAIIKPGILHVGTRKLSTIALQPGDRTVDVPTSVFRALNDGEVYMNVQFTQPQCDGATNKLIVPNTCWNDNVGNDPEMHEHEMFRCYHDGRFYQHAESWRPDGENACVTCRCERGNVYCDEVLCPSTSCTYPIKRPGECCKVCADDNDTERKHTGSCYYHGDKRWHPVGTYWHPYVPPFGYSKCALCNCLQGNVDVTSAILFQSGTKGVTAFNPLPYEKPGTMEVNCTRISCPRLECPLHQRVRQQREDCCQVCPGDIEPTTLPGNQMPSRSSRQGCKFGSMSYKHGDKWHPKLTPFGRMKCYICSCKNSKIRCRKKKCLKLECQPQYRASGSCCPVCLGGQKEGHRSKRLDRMLGG